MPGSRKPILDMIPQGTQSPQGREELIPTRDGSHKSAIDILVEVHGDVEIACERANDMAESEFMYHLARCEPQKIAQGIKAIQLFQVFNLTTKVGKRLMDNLDEIKPGQLAQLYPKLVELIPGLADSKVHVTANQFNFGNTPELDDMPPDIRRAFERLRG